MKSLEATQSSRSFSGSPQGVVSSPCYPATSFPHNSSQTAGSFTRQHSVHTQPQWKADIEVTRIAWTTVKQEHSFALCSQRLFKYVLHGHRHDLSWSLMTDFSCWYICLTGQSAVNKQSNWSCVGARLHSSYWKCARNLLSVSVFCLDRTAWTLSPDSGKFLS